MTLGDGVVAKNSHRPVSKPNSVDQNLSRTSRSLALTATEDSCSNKNTLCTTSRVGNRKRKLPSSLTDFEMSLNIKRQSR